jgi:hypothetical protein
MGSIHEKTRGQKPRATVPLWAVLQREVLIKKTDYTGGIVVRMNSKLKGHRVLIYKQT